MECFNSMIGAMLFIVAYICMDSFLIDYGTNHEQLIISFGSKVIASQQQKLKIIDTLACEWVHAWHYAPPQITAKRDQECWDQLKTALIKKPLNVSETQSLQQFPRDAKETKTMFVAEDFDWDLAGIENFLKKHQLVEVNMLDKSAFTLHAATGTIDDDLLERICNHEIGHIYSNCRNPNGFAFISITIKKDAKLSHTTHKLPSLYTNDQLIALIDLKFGGIANEIVYHGNYLGGIGDMETIRSAAYTYVLNKIFHLENLGLKSAPSAEHNEIGIEKRMQEIISERKCAVVAQLETQQIKEKSTQLKTLLLEKRKKAENGEVVLNMDELGSFLQGIDITKPNEQDLSSGGNDFHSEISYGIWFEGTQQANIVEGANRVEDMKQHVNALLESEQFDQALIEERCRNVNESYERAKFLREANDLAEWVRSRETVASQHEIGQDLEQAEMLQNKINDFKNDLKTNEVRLQDENQMAARNEALGMEIGRDLCPMHALQCKHEGMERKLAALGNKIQALDEKAKNVGRGLRHFLL